MDNAHYTKQVNIVIDYINANIDKPMDVKMLAGKTSLSVYHFHRIFTAVTGEPPAKYVMRRRMELAAVHLEQDVQKPITDIAFDLGFNSVNVFCRNFKKHFGLTAEAYRSKICQQNSKNSPLQHNMGIGSRTYSHYFCTRKTLKIGDKSMDCNFEIKHLDVTHLVYCRHYGAYQEMQGAFAKLMRWAYPKGLVTAPGFRMAAIYHNNPEVTPEEKLVSDACIIVSQPMKTDGEIGTCTLPAGQYAVGRFELSWDEFGAAWQSMFRLLDEHGCKSSGLAFETYLNNWEEHPEKKWLIEICIPVVAK